MYKNLRKQPKWREEALCYETILADHGFVREFSLEATKEAKRVGVPPSAGEIARRVDMRGVFTIAIDPVDAKDHDDAISIKKLADCWELSVHIADVSHYVRRGTRIHAEAFERGTSVYLPGTVVPMLPEELSNNMCSLKGGEDRLAFSVAMRVDSNGDVLGYDIFESVVCVDKFVPYEDVQVIIDNKFVGSDMADTLREMCALTNVLEKRRTRNGAIDFNVPETKVVIDDNDNVIEVKPYERLFAHRIIESFMILCNEVVARHVTKFKIPTIYRHHGEPTTEKVNRFLLYLKPFSVRHKINPQNPTGWAYMKMLDELTDEMVSIVAPLALRSMEKAKYSHRERGHFGLGSKDYLHFTSPIRRSADLKVHEVLKMTLGGQEGSRRAETFMQNSVKDVGKLQDSGTPIQLPAKMIGKMREECEMVAVWATQTEIAAVEAERAAIKLRCAEYMKDRVGELYTGVVNGITEFGVFVMLPNSCEGLVRTRELPADDYKFNFEEMTLDGKKRRFKLGDKIEVVVHSVNMAKGEIRLVSLCFYGAKEKK